MMDEIGLQLRTQREWLGLSLYDVEHSTRVRRRYLEAIEAERFEDLPAETYARGIIRRYCDELRIDASPVLAAYESWLGEGEPERLAQQLRYASRDSQLSMRSPRTGRGRGLVMLVVSAFVLVILGGIYYMAVWLPGLESQPVAPPPVTPAPSPAPIVPTPPAEQPEPTPDPSEETPGITVVEGPGATEITYSVTDVQNLAVEIAVDNPCWIRVTRDGQIIAERTMRAGETDQWEAQNELLIRVGNPNEIEVRIHGVVVHRLQESSPRTLIFVRTTDSN